MEDGFPLRFYVGFMEIVSILLVDFLSFHDRMLRVGAKTEVSA